VVRQRLAGTRLATDPLDIAREGTLDRWPQALRERYTRNLRAAGVLIPLIERGKQLTVLLTRRSEGLALHAGQVSFPGGRMEPGDADIIATALRETHEEVGIAPQQVDIAGFLDPSPTVSGFAVTPVVGVVAAGFTLRVDSREVEQAFEVPLDFLMLEKNALHAEREFEGHRIPMVEFNFGGHRIWGATAHFLIMLRKKLI
jgi:8-oxo-dGTP pyrophosphatase MutT (NUDIX family)